MYKVKKIIKYKSFQKNRVKKNFYFFYKFYKYSFYLILLNSFKLFVNHVILINSIISKKKSKYRKMSRKSQYKNLNVADKLSRLLIKKNDLIRIGSVNYFDQLDKKFEFKKKTFFLKNYGSNYKQTIFINIPYLPFTKKAIGSRMGKGKGNTKNWFVKLPSGWVLLKLISWRSKKGWDILKLIKKKLPNKTKIVTPYVQNNVYKRFNYILNFNIWNV